MNLPLSNPARPPASLTRSLTEALGPNLGALKDRPAFCAVVREHVFYWLGAWTGLPPAELQRNIQVMVLTVEGQDAIHVSVEPAGPRGQRIMKRLAERGAQVDPS